MTVPTKFANTYVPVKYFLSSYRALSDGRGGIVHLDEFVNSSQHFLLSEWKVIWIGTCAILRTAVDLFKIDGKSCLNPHIREEIQAEWEDISRDRVRHTIFWEFLRKERNNIVHQYEWRAYEAWIKPDGSIAPEARSIISFKDDDMRPVILMKSGHYKGHNSLDLLKEGADWVETRIFSTIQRAGFDPDEQRSIVNFALRPKPPENQMGLWNGDET